MLNILKVQVELPEVLKRQQPPYKYKTHHETQSHFKRHCKGSSADKFSQRELMGNIESIILATEELGCNGTVAISIQGGEFEFDANFTVINDSCKEIIEKAFEGLSSKAKLLMETYPAACHSFEYGIATVFSAEI